MSFAMLCAHGKDISILLWYSLWGSLGAEPTGMHCGTANTSDNRDVCFLDHGVLVPCPVCRSPALENWLLSLWDFFLW